MQFSNFPTFSRTAMQYAVAAAALLACSWATAGVVVFNDTTAGSPTWNRPIAGNPPTPPASGVGTAVPYDVTNFYVDLGGVYTFQTTATNPVNWDNYSFLYEIAFDPTMPFANVLIGNDDNPNIGVSGFSFNLMAGVNYLLVETGFSNSDSGAYSADIQGPGNITLGSISVPEPGSLALAGAALAGLAALRRRKAS